MRLKQALMHLGVIFVLCWANSPLCATFKDSLGREVELAQEPERIVSLAPNITEILYSLGLGERVVGVTRFSYYPAEAAKKPKVGSYIHLNVEKIIILSPDLVIGTVAGNNPGVINLVEQAGIQAFIVNARDIQQVLETIIDVGQVCGVPDKADLLAMNLRSRLEKVRQKIGARRKPLVFLQINLKPIMTVNSNSFLHDLIRQAGGINMAKDLKITYPRISIEEVIRRKPEVIIISSMERGKRFETARQDWLKWRSIPAVKNNRVHLIDSDLIDRPSPRIIDGLEAMARIIHPDVEWEGK
ncbi:MAG: cobalamin-binding protein [Deltaproteobacteria bacterium]|nr:cobalamin-binding protein [Deltaproteobacteria bacterium]